MVIDHTISVRMIIMVRCRTQNRYIGSYLLSRKSQILNNLQWRYSFIKYLLILFFKIYTPRQCTLIILLIFYDYTPDQKVVQQDEPSVLFLKILLEKHEKHVLFINCKEIPFEVNL